MFKPDPNWIDKNSNGRKCTAFGHQIGTMSAFIDIAVMEDKCNSREEIIREVKKHPETLKRRKTDPDDDDALFQRIFGHLQWLAGGKNSKGSLRDRLASLYGPSTAEFNDAYNYINKVADIALQKVLGKVIVPSKKILVSRIDIVDEDLPDWFYIKPIIDLMEDKAPSMGEILDKVKSKADRDGKIFKKNWREITRMNIPLWIAAYSE